MTVLHVGPGTLIGVDEVSNNIKFSQGTLVVDEEDTIICFIDKGVFMQIISEKEV